MKFLITCKGCKELLVISIENISSNSNDILVECDYCNYETKINHDELTKPKGAIYEKPDLNHSLL